MEQGTLIGNILAWLLLVVAMTFDFVNLAWTLVSWATSLMYPL